MEGYQSSCDDWADKKFFMQTEDKKRARLCTSQAPLYKSYVVISLVFSS